MAPRSGATSICPPSQTMRQAENRSENEKAAPSSAVGQGAGKGLGVAGHHQVEVVAEPVQQRVAHGAPHEPGPVARGGGRRGGGGDGVGIEHRRAAVRRSRRARPWGSRPVRLATSPARLGLDGPRAASLPAGVST